LSNRSRADFPRSPNEGGTADIFDLQIRRHQTLKVKVATQNQQLNTHRRLKLYPIYLTVSYSQNFKDDATVKTRGCKSAALAVFQVCGVIKRGRYDFTCNRQLFLTLSKS
jgi:hypothetical protein